MNALDFTCPKCGAEESRACVSKGGPNAPAGTRLKRPHPERARLVPKVQEHGTYGGAQAHQRRGEPPCVPCSRARAAYMRDYRASHPADRAHEREMDNARGRAVWRLARIYPDEFRRLVEEERGV